CRHPSVYFLAVVLRAAVLRAAGFFAAVRDFAAAARAGFRVVVVFRAAGLRAVVFLAAGLRAAALLTVVFLTVVFFLAAGFRAGLRGRAERWRVLARGERRLDLRRHHPDLVRVFRRHVAARQPAEDIINDRLRHRDVAILRPPHRLEAHVAEVAHKVRERHAV